MVDTNLLTSKYFLRLYGLRVSVKNLYWLVVEEEHSWRTGVVPVFTSLRVKKSLALSRFAKQKLLQPLLM